MMPKKYIFILFIVLLTTSDSLWACAESLMPQNQHDDTRLRELNPSSQDMLSIASLIAYASESQTVSANHIIMAILTRVESLNEEINRLHFTDIDGHLNFNSLVIILKEFNILREVQEFLLSQLNIQVHNPISFELRDNDLLILHLENISFIPALDYNESANALLEKVIIMKENVEKENATYPISIDHFFLEALRMDTSHFVSELLNKPHIEIVEDFSHKIKQARQPLLSVSKRKRRYYSQETKDRAVELVRQIGNVKKVAEILNIKYMTLLKLVHQYKIRENKPVQSRKKYTPEQRDEAMQLARKVGYKKAAEQLGILDSNIRNWLLKDKKEKNEPVQSRKKYTPEQRDEAVQLARREGYEKAAEQLGIPLHNVKRWLLKDKKEKNEPIQSQKKYTSEQRDEAVQVARKVGYEKAAEQLGIPPTTVRQWLLKDKREKNEPVRSQKKYTPEQRDEAVQVARKVGNKKAAEQLGILPGNIDRWLFKDKKEKNEPVRSQKKYTPEQKNEAMQLARKVGNKKAAEQLGIPRYNIDRWLLKDKKEKNEPVRSQKKYTPEQKNEAMQLARKVGNEKAAEQLGIPRYNIDRWLLKDKKEKNESIQSQKKYTPEQKNEAVRLVRKKGYIEATNQLGISVVTLEEWVQQSQSRQNYTLKEKENAVQLARREGYKKAAERLGIPPTIVHEWLLQYYKNNSLSDIVWDPGSGI